MNACASVDEHFPLSVAQGTMAPEGPTNRSAPTGAGTPCGRGLAQRTEGTTGLVNSLERTPDTRKGLCPTCEQTTTTTALYAGNKIGYIDGHFLCPNGHIFIVRWMGAA